MASLPFVGKAPAAITERCVHAGQLIGERDLQEDAAVYRLYDDGGSLLALVADGMGGHKAGEVASRSVIDRFIVEFFDVFPSLPIAHRLTAGVVGANRALAELIGREPDLDGLGSTLVAVNLSADGLRWVSVGDSLLLHVRGKEVTRLNEDHSMAPLLDAAVRKGSITPEQSGSHRDRNALRSALQGGTIDLIDLGDRPMCLRRGDVILVASDGLATLDIEEIGRQVEKEKVSGAKSIVDVLLRAVISKNRRRQDNATIIAITVEADSKKRKSTLRMPASGFWRRVAVGASVAIIIGLAVLNLDRIRAAIVNARPAATPPGDIGPVQLDPANLVPMTARPTVVEAAPSSKATRTGADEPKPPAPRVPTEEPERISAAPRSPDTLETEKLQPDSPPTPLTPIQESEDTGGDAERTEPPPMIGGQSPMGRGSDHGAPPPPVDARR